MKHRSRIVVRTETGYYLTGLPRTPGGVGLPAWRSVDGAGSWPSVDAAKKFATDRWPDMEFVFHADPRSMQ